MSGKRSEKSFLVEASIISISNFTVKIIGVLFSIPMSNLLQDNMGVFNAAYSVYAMLYMISTAGLPVATSRMVAASAKRGRRYEAQRIYRLCLIMFSVIGFVCALLMFLFAGEFAAFSEHSDSIYAMRVIAPSLFAICIVSAIRGYLQGLRNMVPTAVSQFIEAFFKLTVGLGMAYWSNSRGDAPAVQAAWAISGITIGIVLGMVYLIIYKRFFHKNDVELSDEGCDSDTSIRKKLLMIAIPVTITSSALYLSHFADTLVIKKALIASGFDGKTAGDMHSTYTTLATKLADLLPSTLVFPIAVSILPALSGALAVKNTKGANDYIKSSLRISGLIALPCAAMLFVLSRPLIAVLYGSGWGAEKIGAIVVNEKAFMPIDLAANALSILAVGIFFISLVSTTNALLQAMGKTWLPMVSVLCGSGLLLISDVVLIRNSAVHIYGAPISTVLCYVVAYGFNTFFLQRSGTNGVSPIKLFLKPLIAAIACGGVTLSVYLIMESFVGGDGRLNNLIRLIPAGIVGVLAYALILLAIKGITEREVRLLPFGNRIAALLIKFRMLKPMEDK